MFDLFDEAERLEESTSSPEVFHAKTSRWLDDVLALLADAPVSGMNFIGSSGNTLPFGFSSRTSLVSYPHTAGVTLPSSFEGWQNSGMGGPTGFLTLNMTESHNGAAVSSLSDVLEDGWTLPRKFFLSANACRGILRRAEKRGRELPIALRRALQQVAESTHQGDGEKTTPTS